MKKNFNRNILICVYGSFFICVLCGFIVWAAYRERDFSQKGWMNCDPAKRYLYIEDFEEKYDFYLSKESIFFDCRLHHLASYRIPHIVISKRVKKILEQFSVKQCWYWPVYFEELFNE